MNDKMAIDVTQPLTLKKAIDNFIFHCQYEKRLSDKTLIAYQTDMSQFTVFTENDGKEVSMCQIDRDVLKKYVLKISIFKPKTIKRKIATLKALLNFLEYEDEAYVNPFRKMKIRLKEPHILPVVMTLDEIKKIFQYLYLEHSNNLYKDKYLFKAQIRNIAIVEMLFATGIRVSELCSLKCKDIDIANGIIKVWGKGSKERIIQICHTEVLDALERYSKLFCPESYFFINRLNNPLSTQSVRLLIHHYTKLSGIMKRVTPHTFRHTFATLLLEEDVDIKYIQNLLGHSSIVTTQIYTHVNLNKQKQILSTKHPRRNFNIYSFS